MAQNNLIEKPNTYFDDIMWAVRRGKPAHQRTAKETKNLVLGSDAVQDSINRLIELREKDTKNKHPVSRTEIYKDSMKQAGAHFDRIAAKRKMSTLRINAWLFHKIWRNMFEKIVIHDDSLTMVKKLRQNF